MHVLSEIYKGQSRKLVIALDVGTTFSSASYCLLDPGDPPKICRVSKYPGPEHTSSSLKIPTVLYYDRDGEVKAVGAGCLDPEIEEQAEDNDWMKIEWFKLRMRPKTLPMQLQTSQLPPLPPSKSLTEVFGDYLAYLVSCVIPSLLDTRPTLRSTVQELVDNATFVIAHPNGWEGAQQSKLRKAAIYAKLVPDTPEGRSRVVFVSEGEASLHFCMKGGFIDTSSKAFIVADLGGGTLDFSAYKVNGVKPLRVEEVAASKCDLDGSAFVTLRAKALLPSILRGSKFNSPEQIEAIADCFDKTAKRTFKGDGQSCIITFGSAFDSDLEHGIRAGKLRLSSIEVASLFEPSIHATVKAITQLVELSAAEIAHVYFVGGFSASPYLISEVRRRLTSSRILVSTPDNQVTKAVPDGALSFYIDHFVTARVSKHMYATVGARKCIPFLRDHLAHIEYAYMEASGELWINGALHPVLKSGTAVSEETEFRETYRMVEETMEDAAKMKATLFAYDGPGSPAWVDEALHNGKLRRLLSIESDLSNIVRKGEGRDGKVYWTCKYDLVMKFGGPELLMYASWEENNIIKKTPIQIVYEGQEDSDDDDDDGDNKEFEDKEILPTVARFANIRLGD